MQIISSDSIGNYQRVHGRGGPGNVTDVIFYIEKAVWEQFGPVEFDHNPYPPSYMRVLQVAEVAVDVQANQLLKCRWPLGEQFDRILGMKE